MTKIKQLFQKGKQEMKRLIVKIITDQIINLTLTGTFKKQTSRDKTKDEQILIRWKHNLALP